MNKLIPNVQIIKQDLNKFAETMECDEVILFDRATFLVISSYEHTRYHTKHKFEKLSVIMKVFRKSCLLVFMIYLFIDENL